MHPRLQEQLDEALGLTGSQQAPLALLLKSVHREYRRYEQDLASLEQRIACLAPRAHAPASSREDDSWLQAMLDNIKDAILSLDCTGRLRYMNMTGERMFGIQASEAIGLPIGPLLDLADERPLREFLEDLARERETTSIDLAPTPCVGHRADGDTFPLEVVVSRVERNGEHTFILALRDLSERVAAERALRESEARYRSLVDSAPEAIVVIDPETGGIVDANGIAERLFRYPREQLLALGPADVSPERQPDGSISTEQAQRIVLAAARGEPTCFEWLHQDARGDLIPCEVRLARIEYNGRSLVRGTLTDIRERKRAELRDAGERKVLERMAGNAPLSEVLGAISDTLGMLIDDAWPALYELDDSGRELKMVACTGLPPEFEEEARQIPLASLTAAQAALSVDENVCVADIGSAPVWEAHRRLAQRFGLKGCWSAAIRDSEMRVLGAFAIYMSEEASRLARHLELIDRMIQLAGIAIERKRAERALRSSEARYRGLFENVLDGVYQVSPEGRFLAVNRALVQMLGYGSAEELQALRSTEELYVDPEDRKAFLQVLTDKGNLRNAELRLRHKDGEEIVVLENARAVFDAAGNFRGHEGTLSDITERKRAEMAVHAAKERAQVTLQSIADGVITTDAEGRIDYLNPVAADLTGWPLAEALGRPVGEIICICHESTGEGLENPVEVCLRRGELTELGQHSVLLARDGREVPIQDSAAPIHDGSGNLAGAVLVVHDVSKERLLRRQLAHHATHDALTGLINRREFETRLGEALESARRGHLHVLLYLDLDQFKVVNDTCGHGAGDQLLKQVTVLIRSRVRTTDTVSRLGGDEFGVLLEKCTLERAVEIADDLRASIRDYRFVWKDAAFDIGASIGLVTMHEDSDGIESLLSAADVACYAAKDLGRNRVHVYQHGDAAERHAEMQWVSRVTRALEEGRMELYFQPIVAIGDNPDKRGHYELLLRMRDESGRLVPPSAFIPAAERYNVMPMVDRWVISHALENLAIRYPAPERNDGYTIAINLSGTSLNDDKFLEFVLEEIARHRPVPGAICFEITETAAISNLGRAAHFVTELKKQGCEFSLDDFGSGLSSFTYLKMLPVDYIKIDGHFIRNMVGDHVHQCMVDSMKRVGNAMGIRTIAEHVESRETLEVLESIGVQYAQGFHIAAPAPVARFPRLARRGVPPLLRLA